MHHSVSGWSKCSMIGYVSVYSKDARTKIAISLNSLNPHLFKFIVERNVIFGKLGISQKWEKSNLLCSQHSLIAKTIWNGKCDDHWRKKTWEKRFKYAHCAPISERYTWRFVNCSSILLLKICRCPCVCVWSKPIFVRSPRVHSTYASTCSIHTQTHTVGGGVGTCLMHRSLFIHSRSFWCRSFWPHRAINLSTA